MDYRLTFTSMVEITWIINVIEGFHVKLTRNNGNIVVFTIAEFSALALPRSILNN
jgi:hypothetical protein